MSHALPTLHRDVSLHLQVVLKRLPRASAHAMDCEDSGGCPLVALRRLFPVILLKIK